MKKILFYSLLICLMFTVNVVSQSKKTPRKSIAKSFTINRECDGGNCNFEIVSFNYGRNFNIAVGLGNATFNYYFSVSLTTGNVSKEYIYHDEPTVHFIEKDDNLLEKSDCFCTHLETGEKLVNETLNSRLLDVYKLGQYIVESNMNILNKRYSETGRFAVLADLRNFSSVPAVGEKTLLKQKFADKNWQAFWTKFSDAVDRKDLKTLGQLSCSDFYDGGPDAAIHWFKFNSPGWNIIKGAVISGTRPLEKDERNEIERITNKHLDMIFKFENGKNWCF